MAKTEEVCAECSLNCLSIHGKSARPSSFFKVMFSKTFSQLLFMPPRFAKSLNASVGKTICLEDSKRERWKAVLSRVNGSLALQKGWHEFSVAHGLELGDFLVFHQIRDLHLVVQIYGKSGCEKSSFSGETSYPSKKTKIARHLSDESDREQSSYQSKKSSCPRKKNKTARNIYEESGREWSPPDGLETSVFPQPDVDIVERQDFMKSVNKSKAVEINVPSHENKTERPKASPTTDFSEDSCFMMKGSTDVTQDGSRDFLFDLSTFELPEKKVACTEISEHILLENDFSQQLCLRLKAEPIVEKDLITERTSFSEVPVNREEDIPLPGNCADTDIPLCSNPLLTPVTISPKYEPSVASDGCNQEPRLVDQVFNDEDMTDIFPQTLSKEPLSPDAAQETFRVPVTPEDAGGEEKIIKSEPKPVSEPFGGGIEDYICPAVSSEKPSNLRQEPEVIPHDCESLAASGLVKQELLASTQGSADNLGDNSLAIPCRKPLHSNFPEEPAGTPHSLDFSGSLEERLVKPKPMPLSGVGGNAKDYNCSGVSSQEPSNWPQKSLGLACESPVASGLVKQEPLASSSCDVAETDNTLRIPCQKPSNSNFPGDPGGIPQNLDFSGSIEERLVKQEPRPVSQHFGGKAKDYTCSGVSSQEPSNLPQKPVKIAHTCESATVSGLVKQEPCTSTQDFGDNVEADNSLGVPCQKPLHSYFPGQSPGILHNIQNFRSSEERLVKQEPKSVSQIYGGAKHDICPVVYSREFSDLAQNNVQKKEHRAASGLVKQEPGVFSQGFGDNVAADNSLCIPGQKPLPSNLPVSSGISRNLDFSGSSGAEERLVKQEPRTPGRGSGDNVFSHTSFTDSLRQCMSSNTQLNCVPVPRNSEHSVVSVGKIKLIKEEPAQCRLGGCGTALADKSAFLQEPLSFDVPQKTTGMPHNSQLAWGSPDSRKPGDKMRMSKQEAGELDQDKCINEMHSSSLSVFLPLANMSLSEEVNNHKGDTGDNLNHEEKADCYLHIEVKTEPVDIDELSPVLKVSVQPESESFLELPERLPVKRIRYGARFQPKLVFLRDQATRLWPVVYLDKHGKKVLASGWKAFRQANNILAGDECAFAVEDLHECIFTVKVSR